MEKKSIATWVPKTTIETIDRLIEAGHYVNYADFVRAAIRAHLKEEAAA